MSPRTSVGSSGNDSSRVILVILTSYVLLVQRSSSFRQNVMTCSSFLYEYSRGFCSQKQARTSRIENELLKANIIRCLHRLLKFLCNFADLGHLTRVD